MLMEISLLLRKVLKAYKRQATSVTNEFYIGAFFQILLILNSGIMKNMWGT